MAKNHLTSIAAALVFTLSFVALASYLGAYICLAEIGDIEGTKFRIYKSRSLGSFFNPAARFESIVLGKPVEAGHWAGGCCGPAVVEQVPQSQVWMDTVSREETSDEEWDRAKAKSKELGAPQAKPIP